MMQRLKSFVYAFKGLAYAFKTQANFKLHCLAFLIIVASGFYFKIDKIEWLWVLLVSTLVIVLELLNTAIEILVDLVSPSFNSNAGRVKDLAAAAVLIAAIFALVVGLVIFIPKIFPNAA